MTDAGKAPSRAEIAPPKRTQKSSFLGNQAQTASVGAANNMAEEKKFMLSFSVPVSWHKQFKIAAAGENATMVQVLYQLVEEKYGIQIPPKQS